MNTFLYEVVSIDGDYAHLKRIDIVSDELKLVARALLPPEIAEGTRLKYEWMQYEILAEEKNNGFSLVELILTLAILTFLVCVTVPFALRYMEKNRLTADTQMVDMVRKSVSVVLADPRLANMEDSGCPKPGSVLRLDHPEDFPGTFGEMVAQKLGYDSAEKMTAQNEGIISQLKMGDAALITVRINKDGSCGSATVFSNKGDILLTVK
ncbi:MAG: prepilin-type N-terminal cleavage/methylation domain-containing protein [Lachnospiraceae bacterium]|nr:prepilin-type N-terminal cleavage/methylation domain-containing protein [Lachnospiraceae bacterium]